MENLIPLEKFNYINPIGNFRSKFIIIVRAFLFGSSKKCVNDKHLIPHWLGSWLCASL